jgi:hypothetical protein
MPLELSTVLCTTAHDRMLHCQGQPGALGQGKRDKGLAGLVCSAILSRWDAPRMTFDWFSDSAKMPACHDCGGAAPAFFLLGPAPTLWRVSEGVMQTTRTHRYKAAQVFVSQIESSSHPQERS